MLAELVETHLDKLEPNIEVRDRQMKACVGLTGVKIHMLIPLREALIAAGIETEFDIREARTMAA